MMRVVGEDRKGDPPANLKSDESIVLNKTESKSHNVKRFPLGGQA